MPAEILLLVFEAIEHAPSQVAFALTCKLVAQIATDVDLARSYISPEFAGKLPKEVFDVPLLMKQISTWMPSALLLCDHCLTARPQDAAYWEIVSGHGKLSVWKKVPGWYFANASWHKHFLNICPACSRKCTISDYNDCDGCKALGRVGDVDWSRVSDDRRRPIENALRASQFTT